MDVNETDRHDRAQPEPVGPAPIPDEQRHLLDFVHDRDVECPKCGYNLRNLIRPVCPECREELRLTVGLVKMRFGWFVATLIPGAFSGICAVLLAMPIILSPVMGGGPPPPGIILLDAFGWLSGCFAVGLFLARHRFLGFSRNRQIAWASVVWAIHLAAFAVVISIPFLL
jgi:hypothetical protein